MMPKAMVRLTVKLAKRAKKARTLKKARLSVRTTLRKPRRKSLRTLMPTS